MSEEISALQKRIESAKLPSWVKEYVHSLERERQNAINALNEHCDAKTPSLFYISELESTGEETGRSKKICFIQTGKMEVKHAGINLSIILRDNRIDLEWESAKSAHEIAFIPRSFQSADLVAKENMG